MHLFKNIASSDRLRENYDQSTPTETPSCNPQLAPEPTTTQPRTPHDATANSAVLTLLRKFP